MDHSAGDTSFAPESPDLSNYYVASPEPPVPQRQHYRGSISHLPPLVPAGFGQQSSQAYQSNQSAGYAQPPTIYPQMARTRIKRELDDNDYEPQTPLENNVKRLNMSGNGEDFKPGSSEIDQGINVKTKFPVARIKRIMQADDDVGKVAQVTPVVVSKALELFMITLVTKAATEAKKRNSKRVGAAHLKAVLDDDKYDFLVEVKDKITDAPAPVKDDDEDVADTKKRKGGGRRKKKEDSEDL